MEQQEIKKKSSGLKGFTVFLAVITALASVVYVICRTMQNRAYDEKWSEYDECGLG